MFYTYILQSKKDKQFYTGYTDDMKERLKLHNTGKIASTKYYSKLENGRMNPTLSTLKTCLRRQEITNALGIFSSGLLK